MVMGVCAQHFRPVVAWARLTGRPDQPPESMSLHFFESTYLPAFLDEFTQDGWHAATEAGVI